MESSTQKPSKKMSLHADNVAIPEIRLHNSEECDNDETDSADDGEINYQCAVPEVRSKRNSKGSDKNKKD